MTTQAIAPADALVQRERMAEVSVFSSIANFEAAQRMAKALSSSNLLPKTYQGDAGMGSCLIAMELAARTGAGILAVAQNLHVIEGRPSWSSPFVISAINSCGRFQPLNFDVVDKGSDEIDHEIVRWEDGPNGRREKRTEKVKVTINDKECIAWTTPIGVRLPDGVSTLAQAKAANVHVIEGPPVSIEMAVREGWYTRGGSKWKTMPDLMLRYRAAAFFGRLYASDVLMGMHTREEVEDIEPINVTPPRGEAPPIVAPAAQAATEPTPPAVTGEVLPPENNSTSTAQPQTRARGRRAQQPAEPQPQQQHAPTPQEQPAPTLTPPVQQAAATTPTAAPGKVPDFF